MYTFSFSPNPLFPSFDYIIIPSPFRYDVILRLLAVEFSVPPVPELSFHILLILLVHANLLRSAHEQGKQGAHAAQTLKLTIIVEIQMYECLMCRRAIGLKGKLQSVLRMFLCRL